MFEEVAQHRDLALVEQLEHVFLDRLRRGGQLEERASARLGQGQRRGLAGELDQPARGQCPGARGRDVAAGVADHRFGLGQRARPAGPQHAEHEVIEQIDPQLGHYRAHTRVKLKVCAAEQVADEVLAERARRFVRLRRLRKRCCLARGEPVAAAVEQQRRSPAGVEFDYFADEDHVVAAVVLVSGAAFEACRGPVEQRSAARAARQLEPGEFVFAGLGEAVRQRFLVGSEDVHRKMACRAERGQAGRLARQAPQHHRRVERDRVEAVGGNPDVVARAAAGGDDRYPGGERAQGGTEVGAGGFGAHV